jgi:hypothetical protein
MSFQRHKKYFYMSSFTLILLVFTLLCGCTGTGLSLHGNNSDNPAVISPDMVTALPNNTSPENQGKGDQYNGNIEETNKDRLDKAWKTLRVINTDTNEQYLKLDFSKSDDVNHLRYLLIPGAVQRIESLRSDLYTINPVSETERNERKTLIGIMNYTILKYEGVSTMWHATQYVTIGDPVKMKAELRKAKFQIMDALDIINEQEISQYPSMYRDQVASDKRELDEMASQVESFTRSVYLNPLV